MKLAICVYNHAFAPVEIVRVMGYVYEQKENDEEFPSNECKVKASGIKLEYIY